MGSCAPRASRARSVSIVRRAKAGSCRGPPSIVRARYGKDRLEIHADAFRSGERVLERTCPCNGAVQRGRGEPGAPGAEFSEDLLIELIGAFGAFKIPGRRLHSVLGLYFAHYVGQKRLCKFC